MWTKEAYQDLQTLAAIQFGIHEQTYILQNHFGINHFRIDGQLNEMVLKMTKSIWYFWRNFIGTNKYTESQKGYNIKIPKALII